MQKYKYQDRIYATAKAPLLKVSPYTASNITNDYGMKEAHEPEQTLHDNHELGATMWCIHDRTEDFSIVFDLGGYFPVGKMHVWNYNRREDAKPYTTCGIREVTLQYSLDEMHWEDAAPQPVILTKATGEKDMPPTNLENGSPFDFGGITARYVRMNIVAEPGRGNHDTRNVFGNSYGIAKVRFFMGEGFAIEEDEAWCDILRNTSGWTGSDGVYTIPMNGCENYCENVDTTITFGDTLIDDLQPGTLKRSPDFHMIHNSSCFVPGSRPQNVTFEWGEDHGKDTSLLNPSLSVQNDQSIAGYYWPQDSVLIGEKCYTYPFVVMDWPEGPEGFQFKIDGVAMVVSPKRKGRIQWNEATHHKTNLYYEQAGRTIYYGGCLFPNTERAGAEEADGYIYNLGTIHEGVDASLCLARTLEQDIDDGMSWTFYDGRDWVKDIQKSAPLARDVSCEFSLSYVRGKLYHGQYILIYQHKVNSPYVAYRTAPAPWGPYSGEHIVYFTDDVLAGRGIYTYNAKAHPHLAPPGELLISYNTNTIAWEMHEAHGDICCPKFIRMREVTRDGE